MGFYEFGQKVLNVLFPIFYRIKVEGIENVPDHGFIMVCNHQSYLDPPLLALKLKKRRLTFMAKEELFHKPILAPIIRKLGAFPVSRGKGDTAAFDQALETIKEGKILALFPEGTRSKTGELLKPKSGAAMIACKTGAVVVPAAITYSTLKHRPGTKVTIRYGTPIPSENLHLGEQPAPAEIKAASRMIMDHIAELHYQ